jgi:hypothetical protein
VNVRHKRKVGAIASLKEDRHQRDETKHGVLVMWVQLANDDEYRSRNDTDKVDPQLLCPKVTASTPVDYVCDEAT